MVGVRIVRTHRWLYAQAKVGVFAKTSKWLVWKNAQKVSLRICAHPLLVQLNVRTIYIMKHYCILKILEFCRIQTQQKDQSRVRIWASAIGPMKNHF